MAISDMCLLIGGVEFPTAPFSGWLMVTEIATRNLGDVSSYDLLPAVTLEMGLDVSRNDWLGRGRAITELNAAVLHSFRAAGEHIVGRHIMFYWPAPIDGPVLAYDEALWKSTLKTAEWTVSPHFSRRRWTSASLSLRPSDSTMPCLLRAVLLTDHFRMRFGVAASR
ncbi:nitric oxide synthase oxygenase [Streptomyces sp. NPDC087908]|uniref:nitric oxide synthase oxygenase n=1 Tax=Streptomyces sp. NPDC087908 TaxID=3365820 RepID=UPI003809AA3E